MKNIQWIICILALAAFSRCQTSDDQPSESFEKKEIFWGDIHNHGNIGYARGSLERAYDIAQSHLDFFFADTEFKLQV